MTDMAIEHGHRNDASLPIEHGESFHIYVNVYQRVPSGKLSSISRLYIE